MKKLVVLGFTVALALLPALAFAGPLGIARSNLHQQNESGIRGTVGFLDNGETLMILGTATGLDPSKVYISLIYDVASRPGGPTACEPAIFDPTDPGFLLPTMFVGVWRVSPDGTGTLSAVNILNQQVGQRVYVPLRRFRTISIRDPSINGGVGPEAVVACGQVAGH